MNYSPYLLFMVVIICCGLLTGVFFLMSGATGQGLAALSCSAVLIFLCARVRKRNQ